MSDDRTALSRQSYSREELLHALRVEPCHITGLHSPDHHTTGTCSHMRAAAFERVLALLDATEADLPRALHDESCGWCHRVPSQEKYRERLRETYRWAGVSIGGELAAPAPDAPCFDVPDKDVLTVVKRLAGRDREWVHWDAIREELGLRRHDNKHARPLERLAEQGKIEREFIRSVAHARPA